MGVAAEEAKKYLNQKQIPQLFESLMTGLMYNKPDDPLDFVQRAIVHIQHDPDKVKWDMFIENPPPQLQKGLSQKEQQQPVKTPSPMNNTSAPASQTPSRPASVFAAANRAKVPSVPVVLFIGGPGGGKTKHAVRVVDDLADKGLIHICLPKLIRNGISKYKDKYAEWKDAADKYESGELIPGNLSLALVKAEMGKHPDAKAFLLEGFPREMSQLKEFEKDIQRVDMAIILDYDEETLRQHMKERELSEQVLNKRIQEFKAKSLPAAKYFDDKYLLHLIPGEKGDEGIYLEMKDLVEQAMRKPPAGKQPTPTPAGTARHSGNRATTSSRAPPNSGKDENRAQERTATSAVAQSPPSYQQQERKEQYRIDVTSASSTKPVADERRPVSQKESASRSEVAPTHRPIAAVAPPPRMENGSSAAKDEEEVPKGLPNDAPVVLVVGAPGSQKSEYCKRIARRYDGFVQLSMGELLRNEIAYRKDDEDFQALIGEMDKGEFIPTNVCRSILYKAIHENPKSWGYVVDGYPRTLEQAADFEKTIDRIDLVLLIDSTEQFCLSTLRSRAEKATSEESAELRSDDTPAAVKRRLAMFKSTTLPMLKYFDEKGKLKVITQRKSDVDGDKGIEEVFQEVVNFVDGALFIPQENASGKSLE